MDNRRFAVCDPHTGAWVWKSNIRVALGPAGEVALLDGRACPTGRAGMCEGCPSFRGHNTAAGRQYFAGDDVAACCAALLTPGTQDHD